MKTHAFENKCLALALVVLMVPLSMAMVGCGSVTEVVQTTVNGLKTAKSVVEEAKVLVPELKQINPELAEYVQEYADLAGPNIDNLIAVGNAYLAKPSGDKYQNILNGVDALTATVDQKVLAAAKVSNTASQSRVLGILTVSSVGLHGLLTFLQQKASKAQIKAMPVIAGRVPFEQIKPLIDRQFVSERLSASGYDATAVMKAAGL